MRVRTIALSTLVVFMATLIAACGGSGGSDATTTTEKREATTSSSSTPEVTTTTTEPSIPRSERHERSSELASLPDEECVNIDAYSYMGFDPSEDPETLPSGAQFYYDCPTDYWGWYFLGGPDDKWEELPINLDTVKRSENEDGESSFDASLPLEYSGAPTNRRHPAFPDALTLDELKPGMKVCVRGSERSVVMTVARTFTHVSVYTADGLPPYFSYPAWESTDSVDDPSRSLEEDGVIPNTFGRWSTIHVTAGNC